MIDSTRIPILRRLGLFAMRYRWWVISSSILFTIIATVIGAGVIRTLLLSRYEVPDSESVHARTVLMEQFETGSANFMLMITAKNTTVDDPALVKVGHTLAEELAEQEHVTILSSYWEREYAPALRSEDSTQAIILAHISGTVTEAREQAHTFISTFTRDEATYTVEVGGEDALFSQVRALTEQDFIRSDLVAIPLLLLLLLLVFGNLTAALLTLATSIFSIVGTLLLLRILATFVEISTFALNLTMVLGLGIGVDYCLFIIARFREEMLSGKDVSTAVVRTVETAGRTVAFSALTVAVSLAGLLLFPYYFLRSFAYAGMAVVAMGAIGAVITLPAILAVLGHRLQPWPRWRRVRSSREHGFWYRTAMVVMKRPAIISIVVVALLLFMGLPFLRVNFGVSDQRTLPPEASTRQVHEDLRLNFPAEENDAIQIIVADFPSPRTQQAAIDEYAQELSRLPGVFQVDAFTGAYAHGQRVAEPEAWSAQFATEQGTWLSVVPNGERLNNDAFGLVEDIRAVPAPFAVEIGGSPAITGDFRNALLTYAPYVIAFILCATFIVLFLMTGSLIMPLKATVLNILSLSATFGALVWIFQEGNLSNILAFTPTGTMDLSIPILMFCLAFGLSMDYEVFIMSRIKEEYERTGDNELSVASGIERSGPLVTAAAALLAVAFIAFATSNLTLLRMLGVGMTLAVLMDATVIRGLLVPAFMKMMGHANWWAPRPLQRLQQRIGLSESEVVVSEKEPVKGS